MLDASCVMVASLGGLMNNRENIRLVKRKINVVFQRARRNQAIILTEADLQCQIYMELCKSRLNRWNFTCRNEGIKGNPVHAEVSYFDERNSLSYRVDLTIIDVEELAIVNNPERHIEIHSKEFSFSGRPIIIECKFLRAERSLSEDVIGPIREDYEKARALNARFGNRYEEFRFIEVVFSKHHIAGAGAVLRRVQSDVVGDARNVETIYKSLDVA